MVGSSAIKQFGIARERHRDHHPLSHAARKLMRIIVRTQFRIGNRNFDHCLDGRLARGFPRKTTMKTQRLGYLLADREDGIQRGHRILKDHRDVVTTYCAHLGIRQLHQIAVFEQHLAAHDFSRRRNQTHDRQRGHRLAAAAFAHQPQQLAAIEVKADVIYGAHDSRARREMGLQIVNFEQVHLRSSTV